MWALYSMAGYWPPLQVQGVELSSRLDLHTAHWTRGIPGGAPIRPCHTATTRWMGPGAQLVNYALVRSQYIIHGGYHTEAERYKPRRL